MTNLNLTLVKGNKREVFLISRRINYKLHWNNFRRYK